MDVTGKPTREELQQRIRELEEMVSDFQRSEAARRAGENLLAGILRVAPTGIGVVRDRILLSVNDRICEISGYCREELVGKNARILYPDDSDFEFVVNEKYRQIRDHGTGTVETRWQRKDGRIIDVLLSSTPMNPLDLSEGVTFTVLDITDRKRAAEELCRRENELRKIFEILPIGLWIADKEGTLLRGNPMGLSIWGADPRSPVVDYGALKTWRLPSREPVEPMERALTRTIRERITIMNELLEIETVDGKKKAILNYTAPVLDDTGNVDGAIMVNLDISDRKALEAQLVQSQKMESIGQLAGGVAHDFNNMLSVILGHADMLLERVTGESPLHTDLMEIRKAAQRSANLTRQLLGFARKQTVVPKVLSLNETLESMLKMLRRLIGEDIDLVWKPSKNHLPVRMDPSQVDQILVNLCINARDAIGHRVGKVTIETSLVEFDSDFCQTHPGSLPGCFVMLVVSDDGCGMDEQTKSRIFEPFFTLKKYSSGTGLGLATVYGIVKQNQGFISVYSEPNKGSSFHVYLPALRENKEKAAEHPSLEDSIPGRGNETILVVEDEPSILNMTRMMLDREGYQVIAASSPLEALQLSESHVGEIHLVITDVVLPGMNGRELTENLLHRYPNLKALFLSGYTANVIAHHGILEEGLFFLHKPFARRDLIEKVRFVLDKSF